MTTLPHIIVGRFLVVAAVIFAATNTYWYLGLETTTAAVLQAEGPCYRRGKSNRCDFKVRYNTTASGQITTTYSAPAKLTVGKPLAGFYHPDKPADFYPHDMQDWKFQPFLMFVLGLYLWGTGEFERRTKIAARGPSGIERADPPDWVSRANRRIAEAGPPGDRGLGYRTRP